MNLGARFTPVMISPTEPASLRSTGRPARRISSACERRHQSGHGSAEIVGHDARPKPINEQRQQAAQDVLATLRKTHRCN
jgi:hypothetical protein